MEQFGGWQLALRREPRYSRRLQQHQQNVGRIQEEVAAPEPLWLGSKPKQPFKARVLHPGGRLRYQSGQKREGSSNGQDRHLQNVATLKRKHLLPRTAQTDKHQRCSRRANACNQVCFLLGSKWTEARGLQPRDHKCWEPTRKRFLQFRKDLWSAPVKVDRQTLLGRTSAHLQSKVGPVDAITKTRTIQPIEHPADGLAVRC